LLPKDAEGASILGGFGFQGYVKKGNANAYSSTSSSTTASASASSSSSSSSTSTTETASAAVVYEAVGWSGVENINIIGFETR
jgi:hypothetical protein